MDKVLLVPPASKEHRAQLVQLANKGEQVQLDQPALPEQAVQLVLPEQEQPDRLEILVRRGRLVAQLDQPDQQALLERLLVQQE